MLFISRTKTDGVPAGNNLIKWLLKHEQIVPKKRKYFYLFFKNKEGEKKTKSSLTFSKQQNYGLLNLLFLKTKCFSLSIFLLNQNQNYK